MSVFLLIIGLLLFIALIVVHELGHFWAARRNGVEVEEFGVGFPPRAWKRKTKKGYLFTINWLPLGGFVRMKGENDAATEPGSFGAASFKTKGKIMLAGVGMNLLAALVIFTALGWLGMPQLIDNQFSVGRDTHIIRRQVLIGYVQPGSPAAKAGLLPRDQLLSLTSQSNIRYYGADGKTLLYTDKGPANTEQITSASGLSSVTKQFAGQAVQVAYVRDGHRHTASATLRSGNEGQKQGYLGVAPAELTLTRAGWSAPVQAGGLIVQFTAATFKALGTTLAALFHGDTSTASQQVAGPVGIVVVLHDGSLMGFQYVLWIVGLISLSLAIMNVLPIPALDGGRFYVLLLSRVFGKKLSKDMEERIVGASFVFLLVLIALITVVDVRRFF